MNNWTNHLWFFWEFEVLAPSFLRTTHTKPFFGMAVEMNELFVILFSHPFENKVNRA